MSTYPYEQLNPETFQQFTQALMVSELPNVQCMPVGQRDGGRDALQYIEAGKAFTVFQVKFVRNPFRDFDAQAWLNSIIDEELPKIVKLIPQGATAFYFVTNVGGSAFPQSGSIDRLNAALKTAVPIETFSWWRDDLDRRLDGQWDLKWTYPELMRGPDLIRAVLESGNQEERERRRSSIRAFLRDQYDRETTVRFKQVELQNNLMDLFVDVPISAGGYLGKKQAAAYRRVLGDVLSTTESNERAGRELPVHEGAFWTDDEKVRAADLLLHPSTAREFPKIVLQGAPGQGKSTIAQYLCQVHRMRLLDSINQPSQPPAAHLNSPLRLPFKVDLRDLSAWLSHSDPFAADENAPPPTRWTKSLESFLAAQIRHHSGGTDFTVEDLVAVLNRSAVLIVFDGLDEVADITRRQEVVNEIVRGVSRLGENAASLQAVVTSRPAAFANSPGFPEQDFVHLHLDSFSQNEIKQYADRWIRAKRLQTRESAEVRRILKEKLDQPHIRDLSRNAMQLAILLSLIHRRGSSLPDKRTALYDNYIDLFFSREAEKSITVRDHRDLLIDLHRYVAWLLHTEAEKGGKQTGSISIERLQRVLTEYLQQEGHDTALVAELFHGMVERVIALVSRVQGTLEFEVQPLREYFAARFLYETAPYSPPGEEKRGTKPDRFDAIARNFYWLNVTRFYAGCFSKGELPSLVDRLQELVKDDTFKRLSHPRTLAGILLADWVFSQHPKSVQEVLKIVTDKIGLHFVLASPSRRVGGGEPLLLPKRNGKGELVERCFELLRSLPPRDFQYDVADLISANGTPEEVDPKWLNEEEHFKGEKRKVWLEYGLHIGAVGRLSAAQAESLLSVGDTYSQAIVTLFRARQFGVLEACEEHSRRMCDFILSASFYAGRQSSSVLGELAHALDIQRYDRQPILPPRTPLSATWGEPRVGPLTIRPHRPDSIVLKQCSDFVAKAIELSALPIEEWQSTLHPWDELVELGRGTWGDRWRLALLATYAAGIKSAEEQSLDAPSLLDHDISLCKRLRYARLRAGNPSWWQSQLKAVHSDFERALACLVAFKWCSSTTLGKIASTLENILEDLPREDWERLAIAIRNKFGGEKRTGIPIQDLSGKKFRFLTLAAMRSKYGETRELYLKYLSAYSGTDPMILTFCSDTIMELLPVAEWSNHLALLSRSYAAGTISGRYSYQQAHHRGSLNLEAAREITDSPDNYPGFLVGLAERQIRANAARSIRAVGDIAIDDGWLADDAKNRKRAR